MNKIIILKFNFHTLNLLKNIYNLNVYWWNLDFARINNILKYKYFKKQDTY